MTLTRSTATAKDLSRMYGVPIGTIYRWASVDQWRRTNPDRRPVKYSREDAEESYRRFSEAT